MTTTIERKYVLRRIGPDDDDDAPIDVMESTTMLNALEGWYRAFTDAASLPNNACYAAWREMGDFLTANGR
jgi:beta-glucanase (GH16 family)